jgi:hypothetical protein
MQWHAPAAWQVEVFSYSMLGSDVFVGAAFVDVSRLHRNKPLQVCLPLVPPAALDPEFATSGGGSEARVSASGRIFLRLELKRNAASNLFVAAGTRADMSNTFEGTQFTCLLVQNHKY